MLFTRKNAVSLFLAAVFLVYYLYKSKFGVLVVAGITFATVYAITRQVLIAIPAAVIIGVAIDIVRQVDPYLIAEGFTNPPASTDATSTTTKTVDSNASKAGERELKPSAERKQNFQLGQEFEDDKDDDYTRDLYVDAGTTFMNAYKSLSNDQIQNMRKDTQDLLETQKELYKTLEQMKPLLNDGKQMMESMKNFL